MEDAPLLKNLTWTKRRRQEAQCGPAAELLMLLETATLDGRMSDEEIGSLNLWLDSNGLRGLPGLECLRMIIENVLEDGIVTEAERLEVYKAVERVLPPELRRDARERRMAASALEKAQERDRKESQKSARMAAAAEEARTRPIETADFMVAGTSHEGRGDIIRACCNAGDIVHLVREPDNLHDSNAVMVLLGGGTKIGYAPREEAACLAQSLDKGYRQKCSIKKVLRGRRNPIPVLLVLLYLPDTTVPDALASDQLPKPKIWAHRSAAETSNEEGSGCGSAAIGCLVSLAIFIMLIMVFCGK